MGHSEVLQKQPSNRPSNRPYVLINMAMSADGKIAAAKSHFSRFGSKNDENNLFRIRSTVDGILSGATTINREAATLQVRHSPRKTIHQKQPPFRILATSRGSLPTTAPLFTTPGGPILILTTQRITQEQLKLYKKTAAKIHQSEGTTINWTSALSWLRKQWSIKRLLCEGGGQVNQSLLQAQLVDEINLTICPTIIAGSEATSIAEGTAFPNLEECSQWTIKTRKQNGGESFLRLTRNL